MKFKQLTYCFLVSTLWPLSFVSCDPGKGCDAEMATFVIPKLLTLNSSMSAEQVDFSQWLVQTARNF